VTLSLLKNSENTKKIKYAVENPEDFKKVKQTKWKDGTVAATECRTCHGPVIGRDSKPEKQ
jgi:hypothetical protein